MKWFLFVLILGSIIVFFWWQNPTPEPAVDPIKSKTVETKFIAPTSSAFTQGDHSQKPTDAASETIPPEGDSETQIESLMAASAQSDEFSLQLILTALKSPQPEIREAALEAVQQRGDREAIPALKELAAHTSDAHEKVAILDAIKFLELPSLSELRRKTASNDDTQAAPSPK